MVIAKGVSSFLGIRPAVAFADRFSYHMTSVDEAINSLANAWRQCGVSKGDTLLLHSNIKRTLVRFRRQGVKLMPEHVLESFKRSLGEDGTLLLPTFNFNFPTTQRFDIRNTPSQMGALTEVGRLSPDSIRTGHPIYSFAVLGRNVAIFRNLDNLSGYGADSPFALLKKLDGKLASLDLDDQNSMTFYHHVEEMNAVAYRYFKDFRGTYIDNHGRAFEKTYKLFVRDLERRVRTHVNPAGELMWNHGLYNGNKPGVESGLRTIRARDMYDFVTGIITADKAEGLLFRYDEDA